MTPEPVRRLARARMPAVALRVVPGTRRWDVAAPLPAAGCIGVELGVGQGPFLAGLLRSGRFAHVYGIDAWADARGLRDYRAALAAVGLAPSCTLIRMRFDQALDLFPAGHFDLVYCDGHAHTGQEGGRTLTDWYSRLRPGGVMAGDDYDPEVWPLTVWAVNHLAAQVGAEVLLTDIVETAGSGRHRSWFFVKPEGGASPRPCPELQAVAAAEAERIAARRRARRAARLAAG